MKPEKFLEKYGTAVGTDKAIKEKNETFLRKTQTVATSKDVIDEFMKAGDASAEGKQENEPAVEKPTKDEPAADPSKPEGKKETKETEQA